MAPPPYTPRFTQHQPLHVDTLAVLREIADAIPTVAARYSRIGGSEPLNTQLVTDLINTIIVGPQHENNAGTVCLAIKDTLNPLSQQANLRTDVSPPPTSPKRKGDDRLLTPRTAARGLGSTGSVPIPRDMWQRHAPTNWESVAARTPPVGASQGTAMETPSNRMAQDGLLVPLP